MPTAIDVMAAAPSDDGDMAQFKIS